MLNTVAVGTDGSPTASDAVAAAIDLAERNRARLVVITSYRQANDEPPTSDRDEVPPEVQWTLTRAGEAHTIADQAADRARSHGLEVTRFARPGHPAEVLCMVAAEQSVDVLVVGNKGMHRRVLGSVPNTVAHNAPCSVLIVKTT
jgi:nucleotide-binding universal stress UspA family protein